MATTLKSALAADLSALFAADMPCTCLVNGVEYTVLSADDEQSEKDAYGGPESLNNQEIHFQTKDLSHIEAGELIHLYPQGADKECQNLIVVTTTVSADGAELIVKARAQ
jgi:hypothetical protein